MRGNPIPTLLLATTLAACGGSGEEARFTGEPPGLTLGKLAGSQILIQYEGVTRMQPQVIRNKAEASALAEELLRRLHAGEKFEALAREYSDEGTTARRGGDLGVFEPQDQIRRVSSALAKMHYGEVRGPLHSRFGYHILRRNEVELFGARQILIQHVDARTPAEGVTRSKEEALALAESLLERLRAGEDFGELARAHSDGEEGAEGGALPPFTRGEMIEPFEKAVRELAVGEHSKVVESIYGYHLIERTR